MDFDSFNYLFVFWKRFTTRTVNLLCVCVCVCVQKNYTFVY